MSYSLFPMGPVPSAAQGLAESMGAQPARAPGGAAPAPAGQGRQDFAQAIASAAAATGLDPRLLTAVAQRESGLDPNAVSPAGAEGLMQLMPGTARALGVQNPFDASQNALGGATYLKEMLAQFGGNLPLALAAYNAGPGAVEQHGGIPPYPETEAYVRGVLQSYVALGGQAG